MDVHYKIDYKIYKKRSIYKIYNIVHYMYCCFILLASALCLTALDSRASTTHSQVRSSLNVCCHHVSSTRRNLFCVSPPPPYWWSMTFNWSSSIPSAWPSSYQWEAIAGTTSLLVFLASGTESILSTVEEDEWHVHKSVVNYSKFGILLTSAKLPHLIQVMMGKT